MRISVAAMPGLLGVILSLARCVSAVAQSPECVALKTTRIPFAYFSDVISTDLAKNVSQPKRETKTVVYRTGEFEYRFETINTGTGAVATKGYYFAPFLPLRFEFADGQQPPTVITYSSMPRADWYGIRVVQYESTVSKENGPKLLESTATIKVGAAQKMELSGCEFDVDAVHEEFVDKNPANGKVSVRTIEMLYSPQLRVALAMTLRTKDDQGGNLFEQTLMTTRITADPSGR
jgi:hypothetical protein